MKKILTAILVVAMIASIASISAFAYDPVKISGEAITVTPGQDKAKMNLTVSNIPELGLAACTVIITVDDGISIKSIKTPLAGQGVTGDGTPVSFMWANQDGVRQDPDDDESPFASEMVFATITFDKIPEDAEAGHVYNVTLSVSDQADNYLTVEEDATAGKTVGLGAEILANGTVTIAGGSSEEGGNGGNGGSQGGNEGGNEGGNQGGNTNQGGNDAGNTNQGGNDAGNTNNGGNGATNNGGDNGAANNGATNNGATDAGKTDAGKTDAGKTDAGKTDAGKTDDKAANTGSKTVTKAGPTGDAAFVVIAAMIVALGTAIVVKKVNVK